jgi:hypothetical protein
MHMSETAGKAPAKVDAGERAAIGRMTWGQFFQHGCEPLIDRTLGVTAHTAANEYVQETK